MMNFDSDAVGTAALVWAFILLVPFPAMLVLQARQLKKSAPPPRSAMYTSSILSLWVIAIMTIVFAAKGGISTREIRLTSEVPVVTALAWAVGITIAAELMIIATFRAGARGTDALRELLPVTRGEKAAFVLVSLTAGVTEEIIFRGFLLFTITAVTGSLAAGVLLSAIAFGVVHAYQDPSGIVSAGLLGLLLTVPVLVTGSLHPAIIAHFLIDIIGGFWLGPRLLRNTAAPGGLPEIASQS